jgi:hypothetical protein
MFRLKPSPALTLIANVYTVYLCWICTSLPSTVFTSLAIVLCRAFERAHASIPCIGDTTDAASVTAATAKVLHLGCSVGGGTFALSRHFGSVVGTYLLVVRTVLGL